MIPKFEGRVENGKLTLVNKDLFELYVSDLDGEVVLTVKKKRKDRSNRQNSYYHAVVVKLLADELGYTPDEMHDALRLKFLMDKSRKIPTVRSTTDLSTAEFEDYTSKIRTWASAEMKIYIPVPNEVEY